MTQPCNTNFPHPNCQYVNFLHYTPFLFARRFHFFLLCSLDFFLSLSLALTINFPKNFGSVQLRNSVWLSTLCVCIAFVRHGVVQNI